MTYLKYISLAVLTLVFPATTSLQAQVSNDPNDTARVDVPLHTVSFIPVGPRSEAKSVGQGADMRFIASDPDALPPRRLSLDWEGEEDDISITINRPSAPVPVTPGSLTLYEPSPTAEGSSPTRFLMVDIPEAPGHYDVFFTRDPGKEDWDDCLTLLLPGATDRFPENSVRLVNFSEHPTVAQINDQRVALRPGSVEVVAFTGDKVNIQGAFRDEERWRVLLNTRVDSDENSRINTVFYPRRSDRTPAAAAVYFQPKTQ